ncbi:MAG: glycosyltransferase family 4 protein [Actinomycetota bacterium]|nr:glycosyltransferase family 4 protein [Actinomycetota bacterium]
MRIAFVYDALYPYIRGGVEKRVWQLARRLAARGHEVQLFGMKYWEGPRTIRREGVTLHGVCRPKALYTRSGRRSITQALAFAAALPFHLGRGRFDLIDCQASAPLACFSSWMVARSKDVPLVLTWQEVWGDYWLEYLGAAGRLGRLFERWCATLTHHHVAGSEDTAARLEAVLGTSPEWLIPSGIDAAAMNRVPPSRQGCDIIFFGRLVREKNVALLLEALAVLRRRGLFPRVLIFGDGPERRRLEQRINRLGLDRVRLSAWVDGDEDVVSLMKSAKVLAFPSRREGFGLVVLEAMGSGLPVVTVDHPNNAARHLVGEAGYVTDPEPEAFAGALRALLSDEGRRRTMSAAAIRQARGRDWEAIVTGVEGLYEAVVEGRPAGQVVVPGPFLAEAASLMGEG